ncbi:MAG: hypothetical protein ACT4O0_21515 [Pseudonocardia sp.]
MAQRHRAVAPHVVGGRRVALFVAQAGDLRPDEGPVAGVVVGERGGRRVAGEIGVVGEEPLGQFGVAEPVEIHGQEARVVQPVDVAQRVVELQAVQRPGPVSETEHVVRDEVAVPVEHPSLGDPAVEQRRPPGQEPQGQQLDVGRDGVVQHAAAETGELGEAVGPASAQCVPAALRGDRRPALGGGVERREPAREHAQLPGYRLASPHQLGQPSPPRHPAHHHGRLALAAEGVAHLGQPQVDVRAQPPVQLQLPPAGGLPPSGGAEVEEAGTDRLLDLVRAVADQEHHADVRLVHGGIRGGVRVVAAARPVHRAPRQLVERAQAVSHGRSVLRREAVQQVRK